MEKILVSGPSISQKEIDYVTDAVTNAWYGKANMYHVRFERAFREYLGVRHAMALPSCTSGLHLALASLSIGAGDEVIVPEATWIASSAPVTYVGAIPVFADIDERTWCLSASSLEECITPRTKAIIPVDLYGNQPDWDAVLDIAERHGIAVIEDAAQAIGSDYKGRKAGTLGRAGVFSFHGSKTLTTGEGGMLVTDEAALFERAQFLRDHGRPPGDKMFFNQEVAYKYKMSSMQAALGLGQIERVEELVAKKRCIFSWYEQELGAVPGLRLNYEPPGTHNVYWMVTVILDPTYGLTKENVMPLMAERDIDCRPFFYPLSSIPAYRGTEEARRARARNTVAYRITPYGLNLPSGLNLTQDNVQYVCGALRQIIER